MGATYNWAYRPGLSNKYDVVINNSDDDTRPSNAVYVALFGNDITGNGSRHYPYRTLKKAALLGQVFIIAASGVYRESSPLQNSNQLIGDGDVTLDTTNASYSIGNGYVFWIYNCRLRGATFLTTATYRNPIIDCILEGVSPNGAQENQANQQEMQYCLFTNSNMAFGEGENAFNPSNYKKNNTFYKCTIFFRIPSIGNTGLYQNSIFYNCNIQFINFPQYLDYSIFYNCTFQILSTDPRSLYPTTFYPVIPSGYVYYDTINALKAAVNEVYGNDNVFNHSIITDPLFNNPSIGDYTLQFNSPAKNLSYFGTYVGAKSIAQAIKVSGTESAGGFDFSSAVNLTLADDRITLSNPALDGRIDTRVIVNLLGRELASLPSYGFNADRNGQYIDSIADLATSTQVAGATLLIPVPYLVETGAITYNGAVYQAGERFTTVTGQTTFTTTASGVVREILEAPQRHTVLARFSDGGAAVAAGSALTSGYWYFVQSGSVTYNGATYTAEQVFKAIDTHGFSGSGSVITAMSTESYQNYELGSKPTSNNTGDQRTGAIIRGNGDPAYDRGGMGVKEFPITAKFIQVSYIIKVNNLKP
ncbi:MAG: hypothetical protein JWR38_5238 [Mucilaginibacter sp.]|nr:hypothetical protein [Mucilaginibacter sp.]